jgi:thiol-disulfide isomerase/thioredoxin
LQILTGSELSLEWQLKTTEDNKMQEVLNLSRKEALAVCLKDKSVRLYWTSWCSHCQKQKMLFWKEAFKRLWFVDCDKNKEECIEVWVRGYPTWVINEELFPWVQSLESLAKKTACKF